MLTRTFPTVCLLGLLVAGACPAADALGGDRPQAEAAMAEPQASAAVAAESPSPEGASLAEAAAAEEAPGPEARALATFEAISNYCGRMDPGAANRYLTQARLISEGASEEVLEKVRTSNDYQQAHGELDESLARLDVRSARKMCAQLLLESR